MLCWSFHWLQLALAVSNYFYLLAQGEQERGQETKLALQSRERTRLIWGPFKVQTFVTEQCLIWFLGFVIFFPLPLPHLP